MKSSAHMTYFNAVNSGDNVYYTGGQSFNHLTVGAFIVLQKTGDLFKKFQPESIQKPFLC